MTIAFVTALGIAVTIGFLKRSDQTSQHDPDRVDSACKVIADGVEDWFWWHRTLPSSPESIRPYFLEEPPEWRPDDRWQISFHLVEGSEEDAFYGGRLSRLEVVVRQGKTVLARRTEAVDLRDPDSLWKPHHTVLGPSAKGGLAQTDRNRASAIAEAVWSAIKESGRLSVSQAEVENTFEGAGLRSVGAFAGYEWHVGGTRIEVRNTISDRRHTFPVAGPPTVNQKLEPWKGA